MSALDPFDGPTERVSESVSVRVAIQRVEALRRALLEATRAWLSAHAEWRDARDAETRAALYGTRDSGHVQRTAVACARLDAVSAECEALRAHHELAAGALGRSCSSQLRKAT